jgi:hypothetical protein
VVARRYGSAWPGGPEGPPQPGAAKLASLAAGGHCGLVGLWLVLKNA